MPYRKLSMIDEDDESELLLEHDLLLIENDIVEKNCEFSLDECLQHDRQRNNARQKLIYAAILSVTFMVVEIIGGYMANSLAIMSDAAHLITDSLTFVVGAVAIKWARKGEDFKMSYGYKRVETYCAVISIFGIWILTLFILYSAFQRLVTLDSFEINTNTMLIVSLLGIVVNIIMASILHGGLSLCNIFKHSHSHDTDLLIHHRKLRSSGDDEMKQLQHGIESKSQDDYKSENINVQAASLHVLGDFIQSIGVVIVAVIIKIYPEAKIADPLITLLFSIIVILTTLKIFKNTSKILLEAVPDHVSYENLLNDLQRLDGVDFVHDLRVWSLSNDIHLTSAHIVVRNLDFYHETLQNATKMLRSNGIQHVTLQIEVKR
ncbi:CLUMA_CG021333, isoform A [Clunio marinus]|uniref:CLUMA_CG021333, isoform A n=1 Tax=Clunio marinus TaxID=568069 RepID=A0A1J1JC71_9DIPT|nr:CLUMA_CG021333, isoform A [Clunio marinus]